MIDILRRIKRKLLTGGFAETVYFFLKDIEKPASHGFAVGESGGEDGAFKHPRDKYVVNLSFDFELGFGTTFWEGNIDKALAYGHAARNNFVPIAAYLAENKIPANIQVVGALLESDSASLPIFDENQKNIMLKHRNLFSLTPEDIAFLKSPNLEAGLHGFSHRHFTSISREDALYEMANAVKNFENVLGSKPEFMAFPKNRVAHTDVVKDYGIKYWRADNQHPKDSSEIPLGHWFAPGVLGKNDLKKLLSAIKNTHRGFMLHLWGHFTEMGLETFKELTDTIKEAGWEFATIKNFKQSAS